MGDQNRWLNCSSWPEFLHKAKNDSISFRIEMKIGEIINRHTLFLYHQKRSIKRMRLPGSTIQTLSVVGSLVYFFWIFVTNRSMKSRTDVNFWSQLSASRYSEIPLVYGGEKASVDGMVRYQPCVSLSGCSFSSILILEWVRSFFFFSFFNLTEKESLWKKKIGFLFQRQGR